MSFHEELEARTKQAEEILQKYLPAKEEAYQKTVMDAMHYSAMAGGKRLRPVLMKECFILFGGTGEIIEPFMAALEMIHNYSLVHDDLPAMDNDEYRRGKLTTWKVYGECMAILAGDALLNHANEIMARYVCSATQPRFAKAQYAITRATGISGMIGGQTIDVLAEKEGLDIASEELLAKIYSMKTCALLEGAVAAGAYIAGADEETVCKWRRYALYTGLAFQIVDDILDVEGDESVIGKPVGSDADNNKPTFVTLMGLDGARAYAEKYTGQAKRIAEELGNAEFFVWLADFLCRRDR